MESRVGFDALLPPEMAGKAENVGVSKAHLRAFPTFSLAVLAGAFIALGAVFSTTAVTGATGLPLGAVKVLAGVTFSLGLILGGFHLGDLSENRIAVILADFRRLGVEKVAPCHCTGDLAIAMFEQEYGVDFVQVGVGKEIVVKGK